MSRMTSTKEYVDEKTGKVSYSVLAHFDTGDIEPVRGDMTWEEKVEYERQLLGEQEKQSNE